PQTPAIEKFILIGDHKQLPAVVMQSPKHSAHLQTQEALSDIGIHDLRTSLFERLHRIFVKQSPHCIGMLSRQGRMHPDICDFVSKHFYSERLGSLSLEHQKGALSTFGIPENDIENWLSESRLLFLNCPLPTPTSHSTKSNAAEAEAVALIVKSLVKLHGNNRSNFNAACDIGIIVPFRAQIALVRNRLRTLGIEDADKFTIDTVECYQGSQREFVVFSATISQPYQLNLLSEPHFVEGQWVDRKLNVAITRARQQFIMVGNEQLLRRSTIYNALIDASKRLS
ncbi:MAG: ATP-dependent helicase, partial [Bacteroidaceae bacterium]|nr:ATP-dependent helicase [Bacteroidaceae bacterium]